MFRIPPAAFLLAAFAALPNARSGQAQGFEDMVEEALERHAPGSEAPAPPPPAQPAAPGEAVAPAAETDPAAGESPKPTLANLDVAAVNAAAFVADAEAIRGASALVLKAQVLLDRAGASPGVVDAYYGENFAKAVAAVETVLDLPVDGELDPQVWAALGGDSAPPVLVEYGITAEDVAGPFLPDTPADYAEQAQLAGLYYSGPAEMFSERFHMDIDLLTALNPGVDFSRPGAIIVVAAVEGQPVAGTISTIEADKRARQVRAYDAENRLIVAYPATIGSPDNPSPSGTHTVEGVAHDPIYYYNPRNFVQGDNLEPLQLPPGPNNPVGSVWIDLSRPSYGIHGTPEPSRIDKTGSHGCIRLTNWDAEELAGLVQPGVVVTFVE